MCGSKNCSKTSIHILCRNCQCWRTPKACLWWKLLDRYWILPDQKNDWMGQNLFYFINFPFIVIIVLVSISYLICWQTKWYEQFFCVSRCISCPRHLLNKPHGSLPKRAIWISSVLFHLLWLVHLSCNQCHLVL